MITSAKLLPALEEEGHGDLELHPGCTICQWVVEERELQAQFGAEEG